MRDLKDNMVATRGGGDNLIPRARISHLERDIMVARGNEEVLRARGPHDSTVSTRVVRE